MFSPPLWLFTESARCRVSPSSSSASVPSRFAKAPWLALLPAAPVLARPPSAPLTPVSPTRASAPCSDLAPLALLNCRNQVSVLPLTADVSVVSGSSSVRFLPIGPPSPPSTPCVLVAWVVGWSLSPTPPSPSFLPRSDLGRCGPSGGFVDPGLLGHSEGIGALRRLGFPDHSAAAPPPPEFSATPEALRTPSLSSTPRVSWAILDS